MTLPGLPRLRALRAGSSPVRGLLRVTILLVLAVAAGGCWDRVEVNDLALITGVALDKEGPDSIKMTVSVAVPANISPPGSPAGGAGAPANTTKAGVGRTVTEVLARIQEKTSRRLYWAHTAVILIGEELARDGVGPVLDFFSRQRQPRLQTIIGVVPGKAADMLATSAPVEKNVPGALAELSNLRTGPQTKMLHFLETLVGDGIEPHTARMSVVRAGAPQPETLGKGSGGSGDSQGGGGAAASDPDPEGPLQLAMTGAAIFKGDRLVGYLDDQDTRGLMWLRNQLIDAVITVTLGEPGQWVGFQLISSSTQMTPRFEGERIIMGVKVDAMADITDNAAGIDARDVEVIAMLQEELAETIAVRIQDTVHRVQREFGSDVFGFGDAIRRMEPARWQHLRDRWDDVFPTVELDMTVKVSVRETGLSSRPLAVRRQGVIEADRLREMLRGK